MTLPSIQKLYDVVEATWPPADRLQDGAVVLRDGKGGGKRVSAATLEGHLDGLDLENAERMMREMGQPALFQIREGDDELDRFLQNKGYRIIDPVNVYAAPAVDIATERPRRTMIIPVWEPLKIMEEVWAVGGIGPERVNVMRRGCAPKTGFLGRLRDQPAGAAFLGVSNGVAMVHALEVLSNFRRNGLAKAFMRQSAFWALENGAETLSVVTTRENMAANKLYSGLGMTLIGAYHYRIKD